MERINSVQQLKTVAYRENGDFVEFYLLVGGGLARSVKRMSYRPNEAKNWLIIHEIDDTYQELVDKNLAKKTLIVQAIDNGVFYLSDIP